VPLSNKQTNKQFTTFHIFTMTSFPKTPQSTVLIWSLTRLVSSHRGLVYSLTSASLLYDLFTVYAIAFMTNHRTLRVQRKWKIFNFAFLFLVRQWRGKMTSPPGKVFLNPVPGKSKTSDGEFPRLQIPPWLWVNCSALLDHTAFPVSMWLASMARTGRRGLVLTSLLSWFVC